MPSIKNLRACLDDTWRMRANVHVCSRSQQWSLECFRLPVWQAVEVPDVRCSQIAWDLESWARLCESGRLSQSFVATAVHFRRFAYLLDRRGGQKSCSECVLAPFVPIDKSGS